MGSTTRLRSVLGLAALAAMLVTAALPVAAQGTGTVRGRVTDQGTQRPLSGAQISVAGTSRRAVTNATGEYTLANVPAGTLSIRAELLGYGASSQSVNVAAGATATANFALSTSALSLDALVVTGTPGATERRQLGNAVTQIDAAAITEVTPITSVAQLLQSRAPGLTISTGSGTAGTASNISIRGLNSINGRNRPLVYVDGVRMNTGTYDIGSGGQDFDVLQNIDPNDIESVEVIKGPAAATLYGSEAASGVIQIITKKGTTGEQKIAFSAKGEYGQTDWAASMPTNYFTCTNAQVRSGRANPFDPSKPENGRPRNAAGAYVNWFPGCAAVDTLSADPNARLLSGQVLRDYITDGEMRGLDLSARGGGERYSFFVSGNRSEEDGLFPTEYSNRSGGRGNFFVQPRDNLDLNLNLSISRTDRRLPENDNNSWGFVRNAYRSYPGVLLSSGWELGWAGLSPVVISTIENSFQADQVVVGTTANWQPASWFRNRLTVGLDASDKENVSFYRRDRTGRAPLGQVAARGYISRWNPNNRDYSIDYAGSLNYDVPFGELAAQTSFGMQYLGSHSHALTSEGIGLAFDAVRDIDRAEETNSYEAQSDQKSLGVFVQQQLEWRNVLTVTGALRADDNSAFGDNFDYQLYPKLSAAYVISDEPFFNLPGVDELKLRTAWGRAGSAPAPFVAERAYGPGVVVNTGDAVATGLVPATFGNSELAPEIGTEFEIGLDAGLLGDRLQLEATFYNSTTSDLLLNVPVPPSSGFGGSQQRNVGELNNRGFELALSATPVRSSQILWNSRVAFSTNRNELVSFEGALNEFIPLGYGSGIASQRFEEGYPLAGYWVRDVRRDANGEIILDAQGRASLIASADSAIYIGSSQPTREASLSNTFTLFGDLQLYTFLDYKGGHYLYNMVQQARDFNGVSFEMNDPNFDPQDRALRNSGSDLPYIEKADFVRLREVTLTYTIPTRFTQRFGTDNLSLSLAGRNLALWSKYSGSDPEVNVEGVDNFTRGDFYSIPNKRAFVATVNVRF